MAVRQHRYVCDRHCTIFSSSSPSPFTFPISSSSPVMHTALITASMSLSMATVFALAQLFIPIVSLSVSIVLLQVVFGRLINFIDIMFIIKIEEH